MQPVKRGIVVSDLHCGSFYGLHPPGFTTFEGIPRLQNSGQEYLWHCWDNFCCTAKAFKPDFLIVNGDCVDGMQQANRGSELWLPDWRDQRKAAISTLQLLTGSLPSTLQIYFTQGTPYHVGHFGDAEEDIAEAIGARSYYSVGTGKLCREVLWLNVGGIILEAAHHISASTGFYRLTALDREGQWSAISAKDETKGVPKADLLIRSHVHYFAHAEHESKHIVTTPCWQLQTRYMRKNSVHRMHPSIGGVFVEVGPNKKISIQKELYQLPPVPITAL